ncbi:hypothetical protein DPMN_008938 [Dreissena polymorpha]|uniref:Uncharacterized protein n=1 Tax=Dreissena polymorpha TaxID=45954 RepID=A0A9D4N1F2_DREPO|nr:hypothetical protein DPMN_008938 [Dreissena polymorpha]
MEMTFIQCYTQFTALLDGCDTVGSFVRRGKEVAVKLLEKNTDLMPTYAKFGKRQE